MILSTGSAYLFCPIEVEISAIELEISPIELYISPIQLEISTIQPIWRYLQCSLFGDIYN